MPTYRAREEHNNTPTKTIRTKVVRETNTPEYKANKKESWDLDGTECKRHNKQEKHVLGGEEMTAAQTDEAIRRRENIPLEGRKIRKRKQGSNTKSKKIVLKAQVFDSNNASRLCYKAEPGTQRRHPIRHRLPCFGKTRHGNSCRQRRGGWGVIYVKSWSFTAAVYVSSFNSFVDNDDVFTSNRCVYDPTTSESSHQQYDSQNVYIKYAFSYPIRGTIQPTVSSSTSSRPCTPLPLVAGGPLGLETRPSLSAVRLCLYSSVVAAAFFFFLVLHIYDIWYMIYDISYIIYHTRSHVADGWLALISCASKAKTNWYLALVCIIWLIYIS